MPAGCLLIRVVSFSGLLQNISKWRIVCMAKGVWDSCHFGLGCWKAKAKTKWTHLCMDGQTEAHFWEAYNGGLWPMIWIAEILVRARLGPSTLMWLWMWVVYFMNRSWSKM